MSESQGLAHPETDQLAENTGGSSQAYQVLRALLGMSRMIVAVFVVAHAGLAAILATGRLPDIQTIIIGIFASLFGTGALIGLNDLLDVELDRRRVGVEGNTADLDLGSLFIQHPVAKGIISIWTGIIWVAVLSALSVALIYKLNPSLWPIFILIALFVVLYSVLGYITYWKFLAVASAVTLGALAGWLTVSGPVAGTFFVFAAWTFLWEIGGRNVPNDFNDVVEDESLGVKTIPVVLGKKTAARVVMVALAASFALSVPLMVMAGMPLPSIGGTIAVGAYLLIAPGYRLWRDPRPEISRKLYNKSAIYPLVLLIMIMANLMVLS